MKFLSTITRAKRHIRAAVAVAVVCGLVVPWVPGWEQEWSGWKIVLVDAADQVVAAGEMSEAGAVRQIERMQPGLRSEIRHAQMGQETASLAAARITSIPDAELATTWRVIPNNAVAVWEERRAAPVAGTRTRVRHYG